MEKITWKTPKYGSSKTAYLGHNFSLVANYPLTDEGFEGYVLGKFIGTFESQEDCMKECEKVAIRVINDLSNRYLIKGVKDDGK